jgi:hypothetical protein
VADQYDKPAFWSVLLDSLEAWLKADAGIVALLTKPSGVDVAQGLTPQIPAPCIRLLRGDEGLEPLTGYAFDQIPAQIQIDIAVCAQALAPRDAKLSARAPWDALGALEAATKSALRRYFAPQRDLSSVLGAPFAAYIASTTPTDGSYYPVVGSTITIIMNKKG